MTGKAILNPRSIRQSCMRRSRHGQIRSGCGVLRFDRQPVTTCRDLAGQKVYVRIYGDGPLRTILERSGYSCGSPAGAKIPAIECDGGYVVPFIDKCDCAELVDSGTRLLLGRGSIEVQQTSGVAHLADKDNDDRAQCSDCSRWFDCADLGGNDRCENCQNNYWMCDRCENEQHNTGGSVSVGNESWCQECYDNHAIACQDAD